jgi:hypothetical protein
MELKGRSFTSKEPHVAREPQVADPWSRKMWEPRRLTNLWPFTACYKNSFNFFCVLCTRFKIGNLLEVVCVYPNVQMDLG